MRNRWKGVVALGKELVHYARANPEKLSHCSTGNGTLGHLLMEDLKRRTGMRMLHSPTRAVLERWSTWSPATCR